jgi:sugar phosphate isomerase/epimerase
MKSPKELVLPFLMTCVLLTVCQTITPEEVTPPLRLACRINSYGAFQEAAWDHLPSLGIHYIFLNIPAEEQVEDLQRRLAEHDLTAIVLRGDTDLSKESSLDELESQFAICKKMGVRYMFLSPKRHDAEKEAIYERLRQVGNIAQKYGVTVALETHPDLGTNGDIHLETMRQINHPNVRVNFDTGNIHYYNEDRTAPDELRKIIDYVATVEIKDHNGVYNDWNFPALGKGIVDIPAVLKVLREHRYDGPVTVEIEGIKGVEWDEETTKQVIEESVKYLRSLDHFN